MSQQRILREVNERIKQNLKQGQLTWLQLDSIPIRQITKQLKSLLEEYPLIQYLTMNDCQLTTLSNFPKLDNLSILQLSNNQIQDDELFHLLKCSHISHLMIDQNRLRNIQKISILRQLPNLQQLQIAGNRIGDSDFYRQQLFDRIPHLKIIDCHDMWGNIAINSESEEDQEGQDRHGHKHNAKLTHAEKEQQKSLLNLLGQQDQDQQQDKSSSNQNLHTENIQTQKQHNHTVTSSSVNSLNQLNNSNNLNINLNINNNLNNNITGSKRIKKQQEKNDQLKQSKVANKRTSLIQQQSSSPDLHFLPFNKVKSELYQE